MKIALLTNEYPPHVYGGAGVHVEYLTQELANLPGENNSVTVLCFGEQKERLGNITVNGTHPRIELPSQDRRFAKVMDTLLRNLIMAGALQDVDIVHCHTWYVQFAGCLVKQLLGIPLVLTTHSLEPHRPWKAEQLGPAYHVTTWLERTAYQNADGVIAVSKAMQRDVQTLYGVPPEKIRVIYNGIDLNHYKRTPNPAVLLTYNINPEKPFVLFVGRITRQKGILHLINAVKYLRPGYQIVLCAGAPDTEEIGREMAEKVKQARSETENEIIWIREMLPKEHVIGLYSNASLFICPSVYEPFGIINLEAMACETPVVASAVGGIPEVVVHGETGLLVPLEPVSAENFEPKDPEQFARDLARAVNELLDSPEKRKLMGAKARARVEQHFGWPSVARQTFEFYQQLIGKAKLYAY
jgi:glycogen synthase